MTDDDQIPSFLLKGPREEPVKQGFFKRLFRRKDTNSHTEIWEPSMKRVIVESPYAGEVEKNVAYAKECCLDCVKRGEVPFASHLFFTQFLDDNNSDHRTIGVHMGYDFWEKAEEIVFYTDLGLSPGMERALAKAFMDGKPIKKRSLGKTAPIVPQTEVQRFAPKRSREPAFAQLEADLKDATKDLLKDAKDLNS